MKTTHWLSDYALVQFIPIRHFVISLYHGTHHMTLKSVKKMIKEHPTHWEVILWMCLLKWLY